MKIRFLVIFALSVGFTLTARANYSTNYISGFVTYNGFFIVGNGTYRDAVVIENSNFLETEYTYIGYDAASSNNGAIVSSHSGGWDNSEDLEVGYFGAANSLTVSNNGYLYSAAIIVGANASSSNNSVLVNGSQQVAMNELFLGYSGAGNSLTISNGGLVYSYGPGDGYVGYNMSSSNNSVLVTGIGSEWFNGGNLYIGNSGGSNSVTISSGGAVFNSTGYVGYNASSSNNSVLVTGTGSIWSNGTDLYVGLSGTGNRVIMSNGGLVVAQNVYIGENAGSGGTLSGCGTMNANVTVATGGLVLADCGGSLTFTGILTNNGTMKAINGSVLEGYGLVVNNGVIDLTSGTANFHAGFINNGTVIGGPTSGVLVYYPFNTNGISGSGNATFTNNYLETATIGTGLSMFTNYNVATAVSFVTGTNLSAQGGAPAGNAVTDSNWVGNTNYFQFTFNATGIQNIIVNYDVARSNTGPVTNQLQYSTNGGATFIVFANNFNALGGSVFMAFTNDLSAVTALTNNPNVVFRIVGTGSPASGGTMRVDNFTVSGVNTLPYTFTTLAGLAGSSGSADGTGSSARFISPRSVVVDGAGNVYVTDFANDTIRKVTPAGVVTTLAGLAGNFGSADGTGASAQFKQPFGVAVDSAGNVYVTDSENDTIRKITSAGVVTTLAGLAGSSGSVDGIGASARFSDPAGVAVDNADNLYVADAGNNTIRQVTSAGTVTTLAGLAGSAGSADGTGASAQFNFPEGMAVDSAGNVYVGDNVNDTIRKITPVISGQLTNWVVSTLAGLAGTSGSADGTGTSARFKSPEGVAVDSAGNLYVVDTKNDTIRQITPGGAVTTLAGLAGTSGSTDATGSSARFKNPEGVAVDSAGNLYVADTQNDTIRKGSRNSTPSGIDIGLRVYDGTGIIKIGAESGTPTSPLRINKNGTNYGIILVATNSASASRIHIQTSEGTKSFMKLP